MNVVENYEKALQELYDHVGFKEDWVVYPIDSNLEMIWETDDKNVKYSETVEKFLSDGDYYMDDIYNQRFYDRHIYEGEDYTMIFCDPGVDGMKWFRVFKNTNRASIQIRNKKIDELMTY